MRRERRKTTTMQFKECRRELEELSRTKDMRTGEAGEDYAARMLSTRRREDELRGKVKSLKGGE